MSVDMFERRFRQELNKLPLFERPGTRNPHVEEQGFPAWRALFSSHLLHCHATGYRLPDFPNFYEYCRRAFSGQHQKNRERYERFFNDPSLMPGMMFRVANWYESGMAETHLYASITEMIEDKAKCGLVLYDPRLDWKMKADLIVLINGRPIRINAYYGNEAGRRIVELNRDVTEHVRKVNTSESAHWENKEYREMRTLEISRDESNTERVNGIGLFSRSSINELLAAIYDLAEVTEKSYMPNS